MKKYLKVFLIAFVATMVIVGTALAIYIPLKKAGYQAEMKRLKEQEHFLKMRRGESALSDEKPDLSTLNGLIEVSKRMNVVVLGIDGGRTDTIIVVSYDFENKLMDFITVPRDTYHWVPGYDALDQRKINAVFGFGEQDGGGRGCKAEIGQLLGIPIHYYVIADYNAVSDIVDTVGGVDVLIEEPMHYDDIMCDPPLHIHFDPGVVTLNGQSAIEYLRWRKNNGEYGGGDIPRTGRQMGFVKTLMASALSSFKFDKLVDTCYKYVSTDMPLSEAVYYATTLFGFDMEQGLVTHTLPGEAIFDGLSYYAHEPAQTEALMMGIYRKREIADNKVPINLSVCSVERRQVIDTSEDYDDYYSVPQPEVVPLPDNKTDKDTNVKPNTVPDNITNGTDTNNNADANITTSEAEDEIDTEGGASDDKTKIQGEEEGEDKGSETEREAETEPTGDVGEGNETTEGMSEGEAEAQSEPENTDNTSEVYGQTEE